MPSPQPLLPLPPPFSPTADPLFLFRKSCAESAQIWAGEALRATGERQLLFLYLANDIMQTSRRKLLESEEKWGRRESGGGVRLGEEGEKRSERGEDGLFRRRLADARLVERGGDESRRDFVGG